jgi:hypothetical protein
VLHPAVDCYCESRAYLQPTKMLDQSFGSSGVPQNNQGAPRGILLGENRRGFGTEGIK